MSARNGTMARISEERAKVMGSLEESRQRLARSIEHHATLDDLEGALAAIVRSHRTCRCDACSRAVQLLSDHVAAETATG
jgi:hypothetical protein